MWKLYIIILILPSNAYSILLNIIKNKNRWSKKSINGCLKRKISISFKIENKHFNFDEIGKSLNGKITKKLDESEVSKISIEIGERQTTKGNFNLNKNLLSLGEKGLGRLDIYVKVHIIKSIILYLGIDELAAFTQNFKTMEDDLMKISEIAEKEKFTMEKYNDMDNFFANGEKKMIGIKY